MTPATWYTTDEMQRPGQPAGAYLLEQAGRQKIVWIDTNRVVPGVAVCFQTSLEVGYVWQEPLVCAKFAGCSWFGPLGPDHLHGDKIKEVAY